MIFEVLQLHWSNHPAISAFELMLYASKLTQLNKTTCFSLNPSPSSISSPGTGLLSFSRCHYPDLVHPQCFMCASGAGSWECCNRSKSPCHRGLPTEFFWWPGEIRTRKVHVLACETHHALRTMKYGSHEIWNLEYVGRWTACFVLYRLYFSPFQYWAFSDIQTGRVLTKVTDETSGCGKMQFVSKLGASVRFQGAESLQIQCICDTW